jgi:hypothetical protein
MDEYHISLFIQTGIFCLVAFWITGCLFQFPTKGKKSDAPKKKPVVLPTLVKIIRWQRWWFIWGYRRRRWLFKWVFFPLLGLWLVWDVSAEMVFYRMFVVFVMFLFSLTWKRRWQKLKGRQQQVAHLPPRRGYVLGSWQEDQAKHETTNTHQESSPDWGATGNPTLDPHLGDQRLPQGRGKYARVLGLWQRLRQK